jgi:hypothetical protein
MAIAILRARDLYNRPGKRGRPGTRGLFNVSRTTFYQNVEPDLERVRLTARAVGYTDRSVQRKIRAAIAAAAAEDRAR